MKTTEPIARPRVFTLPHPFGHGPTMVPERWVQYHGWCFMPCPTSVEFRLKLLI